MKTPFFGPFDVTRSTNLADNQLINLRPELVETHDGKNVGALMGTPGLDLLSEIGLGPIRGLRQVNNTLLYVVSGENVYTVGTSSWNGTLIGSITESVAQVSMIDNGKQVAIFGKAAAWVAPAGQPF